MRFKVVYQFLTGDKVIIKARGKRRYEAIKEEHLTQRRNNDNETNKHVPFINCETFDTEELICDDPRWEGLFLTPEQVFFRKLWLAEQEEKLQNLPRVMKTLTKEQKRLIKQYFFKEMSTSEIAELECLDISGIRKKLKRTLRFMRRQF